MREPISFKKAMCIILILRLTGNLECLTEEVLTLLWFNLKNSIESY